ncbi:hypothetical protein SNEBB_003198 [Seison nebaliae]|nr:hypothetical protein SNEBB_003198 [Seison nebaliae]
MSSGLQVSRRSKYSKLVPNTQKDFNVNDLVLVSVKGYPIWPGKIEEQVEIKGKKIGRYKCRFFGTNETLITGYRRVYDYQTFTHLLNERDNRKFFQLALWQIKNDPFDRLSKDEQAEKFEEYMKERRPTLEEVEVRKTSMVEIKEEKLDEEEKRELAEKENDKNFTQNFEEENVETRPTEGGNLIENVTTSSTSDHRKRKRKNLVNSDYFDDSSNDIVHDDNDEDFVLNSHEKKRKKEKKKKDERKLSISRKKSQKSKLPQSSVMESPTNNKFNRCKNISDLLNDNNVEECSKDEDMNMKINVVVHQNNDNKFNGMNIQIKEEKIDHEINYENLPEKLPFHQNVESLSQNENYENLENSKKKNNSENLTKKRNSSKKKNYEKLSKSNNLDNLVDEENYGFLLNNRSDGNLSEKQNFENLPDNENIGGDLSEKQNLGNLSQNENFGNFSENQNCDNLGERKKDEDDEDCDVIFQPIIDLTDPEYDKPLSPSAYVEDEKLMRKNLKIKEENVLFEEMKNEEVGENDEEKPIIKKTIIPDRDGPVVMTLDKDQPYVRYFSNYKDSFALRQQAARRNDERVLTLKQIETFFAQNVQPAIGNNLSYYMRNKLKNSTMLKAVYGKFIERTSNQRKRKKKEPQDKCNKDSPENKKNTLIEVMLEENRAQQAKLRERQATGTTTNRTSSKTKTTKTNKVPMTNYQKSADVKGIYRFEEWNQLNDVLRDNCFLAAKTNLFSIRESVLTLSETYDFANIPVFHKSLDGKFLETIILQYLMRIDGIITIESEDEEDELIMILRGLSEVLNWNEIKENVRLSPQIVKRSVLIFEKHAHLCHLNDTIGDLFSQIETELETLGENEE